MASQHRLSPTMVSRKLQALRFIRDYIGQWGKSPSYGEIAAELGTNRVRVHAIVRQLVADGDILHAHGERRGISLAAPHGSICEAEALQLLRRRGYLINGDLVGVEGLCSVTKARLPGRPALVHLPDIEVGEFRDDGDGGAAGG